MNARAGMRWQTLSGTAGPGPEKARCNTGLRGEEVWHQAGGSLPGMGDEVDLAWKHVDRFNRGAGATPMRF